MNFNNLLNKTIIISLILSQNSLVASPCDKNALFLGEHLTNQQIIDQLKFGILTLGELKEGDLLILKRRIEEVPSEFLIKKIRGKIHLHIRMLP